MSYRCSTHKKLRKAYGDDPVGEIAELGHLEAAQNGEVDVSAADGAISDHSTQARERV